MASDEKSSPDKKTSTKKRDRVRRRPGKYEPSEVAAALRASRGIQFLAAEKLGCSQATIATYMKRYKTVRDAIEEGKSWRVQFAESKLLTNIGKGKEASIFFLLKTQGNYIEKHAVQVTNEAPDEVKIK